MILTIYKQYSNDIDSTHNLLTLHRQFIDDIDSSHCIVMILIQHTLHSDYVDFTHTV